MFKLRELLSYDKYKMILVGLDNEQVNSLPQGVEGIQRTNGIEELRQLYGAADVFVNPTIQDNYPMVNLESIACGTPVVTYKTGGSVESASFYGAVCEDNTPYELVKYIENGGQIKENGNVYNSLSSETMLKDYLRVILS